METNTRDVYHRFPRMKPLQLLLLPPKRVGGGGGRGAPGLLKLPREKPRPSAHELLPPDPRRGSVAPRMAGMAATAGRGRRRQGGGAAAVGGGEDGRK